MLPVETVTDEAFDCPVLAPIGVVVFTPEIAVTEQIASAVPPVHENENEPAATSVELAIFQKISDFKLV
jgi:hypothetical protein